MGTAVNRAGTVRAADATPAAIAKAFAQQSQSVRWGPLGPVGQSMILIPCAAAGQTLAAARSRTPAPRPAPIITARQRLRGSAYAIGGYAAAFGREYLHDGIREVIKGGAFARALAAGGWYLLADHRASAAHDRAWTTPITSVSPSRVLASMAAGTLHAEEDSIGLWVEACLPLDATGRGLIDRQRRGHIRGLSTGSLSAAGAIVAGVRVLDQIAVWEISLCIDHPPARAGTWLALLGEADRMRRERHGAPRRDR